LGNLQVDNTDHHPAITFDQPNQPWVTYLGLEVYGSVDLQLCLHLVAEQVSAIAAVDDVGAIERLAKWC
jgi:hypothetical protein